MASVLVTGAAAGIGRATVHRFARAGWRVAAADVDLAGVQAVAAETLGVSAHRLDVRSVEDWDRVLADFTSESGGQLDVLVNNAGVLSSGSFAELSVLEQQRMVEINVGGVLTGCHRAHRYLAEAARSDRRRRVRVVNLASSSAIYGQPELAVYSATKFAVRGLTEALDLEWATDRIAVRSVWPLFVASAMTADMDISSVRRLGIHLTPQDVAEVVFATATSRRSGPVHRGVGRDARLMLMASAVTPTWLLRRVNARIAR